MTEKAFLLVRAGVLARRLLALGVTLAAIWLVLAISPQDTPVIAPATTPTGTTTTVPAGPTMAAGDSARFSG